MKRSIAICIAILTCAFCRPSLVLAEDPPTDPFYRQGVSKDAPPINSVSEEIDPFSGILTLSHTDLHLPGNGGLDLKLIRTYNSMIWGRREPVEPGLIARLDRSPLGIGWNMHMGIVSNPFGDGSNNARYPNNPVVIMPDGSRHIFYKDRNDTTRFISKEFWIYKYISGNGYGVGTWELTLTDGTVYTFEYMTGNAGYNVVQLGVVVDKVAQVTKIRNAANNAAVYMNYYIHSNGYSYLSLENNRFREP